MAILNEKFQTNHWLLFWDIVFSIHFEVANKRMHIVWTRGLRPILTKICYPFISSSSQKPLLKKMQRQKPSMNTSLGSFPTKKLFSINDQHNKIIHKWWQNTMKIFKLQFHAKIMVKRFKKEDSQQLLKIANLVTNNHHKNTHHLGSDESDWNPSQQYLV